MTVELRKLQSSKTGYYINLPKKIIKELNLTGQEIIKITHNEGESLLSLEILNLKDNSEQ